MSVRLSRRALAALLLLPFLLAAPAVAQAQSNADSSRGDRFSVQFVDVGGGIGTTSAFEFIGDGASANITVASRRYALSARVTHAEELAILGPPPRASTEIGVLAGRQFQSRSGWFMARAQVGLGVVLDQRQRLIRRHECPSPGCFFPPGGDYESYHVPALGVSAEVETMFVPLPYVGLGLRLVGNANIARSFGGAFLTLHVGRLRQ